MLVVSLGARRRFVTRSVTHGIPTLEWYDPRRLDTTFGGIMGRYTEQAKLAAVQEYCAGKAG
ncbi:hypothetical protein, partial [Pseudomonas syringae]|uniref:hypothetical protein n=1 Tax=Pseudomonas syringae TaxID=317 RepID=UPI0024E1891E